MEASDWILLAENDADDAFLIKRILEQACPGYEIVTGEDGSAALRCIRGECGFADPFGAPPAVMILDHAVPGQTGLTVLRTIRQDEAIDWIPVVMCSGMMTRSQVQE